MIPLTTRGTPIGIDRSLVCKVVRDPSSESQWSSRALVCAEADANRQEGFAAIICDSSEHQPHTSIPMVIGADTSHLRQGDVVAIHPIGLVRTVYRRGSPHNTLFATERCNSFCVMCSQPPREIDDGWRVEEMVQTVQLMDPDVVELGISGGEPTLLGDGLIEVLRSCRDSLPNTAIHVLSNGRLFRYTALAKAVADLRMPDIMFGIPVYSDLDYEHDYVVQAKGAFEDTILGLHNLARFGVAVEIRVVVHRFTYKRLPELAGFIYRNLTFARHVALMGLEATGFAKGNMDALWVDPWDYREQLERATLLLAARRMHVSIYNHQLCTVSPSVRPYCRRSISDWKNDYLAVCGDCAAKTECGGFFSFNLKSRLSTQIHPIAPDVLRR
jgi:His-Xaa-Ser system radical SAM maturase HxsC